MKIDHLPMINLKFFPQKIWFFLIKSFFGLIIFVNFARADEVLQHNSSTNFQHGISIFGDLKYSQDFKNLDYVDINAKKGGEVHFGVEGGYNSFNNFILKGIGAEGLNYLYDSLMEGTEDEIGSRYGLIAKEAKLSKNRLTLEFKLRENAFFHDGKNISADDVIFTFNKLITDGHPSYKMSFRDVENVEKIGKFHVKFNFKNADNRNLPLIIASLPILPKHFYEKNDFSKSSLTIPIGSGPYKIKDFVANRYVAYERNKNYWGANLPINIGRYNFDKIIFDYYRDNNVLIEAFKAQKYDFRQENVARNWANAYNIKAVENGEIIKREIEHEMPAPTQVFILNLRKNQFQNFALRKAITQVFDFEWLRDHIFYGSYKRNESYFTNSEFAFTNFKLPKTTGDGINRQNIIIAQKILADAGYQIIDQKLIDPMTKKAVSIEFMIDQKAFEMVVAPYLKNLKKLGIDAKMRFVEENQFQTRINNFDFEVMVGVYPQNIIPGSELYGYFHSSQKDIKGSRNLAGLDDKYVDELVEKISSAQTKDQLKYFCKKLDKYLLENYFAILQWHNNKHRVLYRDIFEFPKTSPKYSLAIDSWWLKPSKLQN